MKIYRRGPIINQLRGSYECLLSISSEVLTSAYKVSVQRFLRVLTKYQSRGSYECLLSISSEFLTYLEFGGGVPLLEQPVRPRDPGGQPESRGSAPTRVPLVARGCS